jgi:hypothetical protein
MLLKTPDEVATEFKDDVLCAALEGTTAFRSDVIITDNLSYAQVKAGLRLPCEHDWSPNGYDLGSPEREEESAEEWTAKIPCLEPVRPDEASWEWDELYDRVRIARELTDELGSVPQKLLGGTVSLSGTGDIGPAFMEAMISAMCTGIELPIIERVKNIWRARGFVMGMEGFVPEVWPNGKFIVYWPYTEAPQIESSR